MGKAVRTEYQSCIYGILGGAIDFHHHWMISCRFSLWRPKEGRKASDINFYFFFKEEGFHNVFKKFEDNCIR